MSLSTKTWLREQSLRGYMPGSCARARASARQSVTWRPTGFLHPSVPRARAVDRRVAAVLPETKASKCLASRLGPNCRRLRPRKRSSMQSHASRALEPKTLPSRPRRPRPSLPAVALCSIKPGPPFPVHLSVCDERKQRRELLLRKAPQAERHKKLPIVIDGVQVRA